MGKKDGFGKYFWSNGSVYEGNFKNGQIEGKGSSHLLPGKFTCTNGDIYDGNWSQGLKNGEGTLFYKSGAKYEGEFQ